MNRYYLSAFTVLLFLFCSFAVSCKTDDEEENIENILKEYKWKASPDYDLFEWGDNEISFTEENITLFFLDNGKGICKVVSKEIDTHFGEDKSTYEYSFIYTINGNSVTINNGVNVSYYQCENDVLVDTKGRAAYSKESITISDREWLESKKYEFMPDEERLNFDFFHGCSVVETEPTGKSKSYLVFLSLKVDATQKVHSRLIDVIRGSYTISGGKFSTKPKLTLLTVDDNGNEVSTSVIVETTSEAIISATFEAYDRKYGKYIVIGDAEYNVSDASISNDNDNNDNIDNDNNDNENNTVDDSIYDLEHFSSIHTKPISYKIDNKEYKMILVDGGAMPDFYIMQTEIDPQKDLYVNGTIVRSLDRNKEKVVIKAEFRNFIRELRKATNMPFRLPTKEEWQFAARGGKYSKGYKYSGSNSVDDVAWYYGNSNNKVHEIATKQPNELGIYDMSGNYAELCNNTNNEYYIDDVSCGGCWNYSEYRCTVTSWVNGITSGKVKGHSNIKEKNAFDASLISIRLVYSKQ